MLHIFNYVYKHNELIYLNFNNIKSTDVLIKKC